MKRFSCFFLALTLILILPACGGGGTAQSGDGGIEPTASVMAPVSETGEWAGEGGCYVKQRIEGLGDVWLMCAFSGTAYLSSDNTLFRYAGGELTELVSLEDGCFITELTASAEGVWAAFEIHSSPAATTTSISQELRLYSDSGELLRQLPLGEEFSRGIVASGEYLYIHDGSGLRVLSPTGESAGAVDTGDGWVINIVPNAGGIAVVGEGENGMEYSCCSAERGFFAGPYEISGDGIIQAGYGEFDCLLSDGAGLYGFTGGDKTPLVIWTECGISANDISRILRLGNDSFIMLSGNEASVLREAKPDELIPRAVVTMGAIKSDISFFSRYIDAFNQYSEHYYVELVDLAPAASNTAERITAINTQLISGNAPDILYFGNNSPKDMGDGGFLADLYEYIDADDSLSREDFLALKALETDGALYTLSPGFTINTFIGLESSFGQKYGWTFEGFFEMQDNLIGGQTMFASMTREDFLTEAALSYLSTAVSIREGRCDLDNAEFIRILRAVAAVDENEQDGFGSVEQALAQGTAMLAELRLDNVNKIIQLEKSVGKNLWPVGFPSADGSCASTLSVPMGLGMCAQAQNCDGAWEFIKFAMTNPEVIVSYASLPAFAPRLESEIDMYLHPEEYQNSEVVASSEPLISRRQIDMLYRLIENVSGVRYSDIDNTLLNIILEEAASYFAGDRSAEDCAKIIQSRVQIYVSEQS